MSLGKDESGASIIIIALLFPVVLVFFAVVLDVANLILTKRQLQVMADAGALAGASCFEVFGEAGGEEPVTAIRITSSAVEEADRAIEFNATNFNFDTRGIAIIKCEQFGVGTDAYLVELTAEVPTLLVGAFYTLVQEEGGHDKVIISVVSEVRLEF